MSKRRVVFYARVSTEHEAQIHALGNQIDWYYDLIKGYKDWELVGKYIDEGITGTNSEKRPEFLKMMDDGIKRHEFDLIVTREVCRFARNTVDTLTCTRNLKSVGIEIYFVSDNIWTFDKDGELRLTIMATLAQDESRRISERVIYGLGTARKNGVILGNGNILGYTKNKITKEFEIVPEEADTVKEIYENCLKGKGCKKIKNILEKEGRLTSIGESKWQISTINRILSNPFYAGFQYQQQSVSDGYLTQNRVKNDKTEYVLVKGKHQPIITMEMFNEVQNLKAKRLTHDSSGRITGNRIGEDVWVHKLVCVCGSRYRKYKWRPGIFGYTCYNQVINGKASNREKNGLDTEGACDLKGICDWKLDLISWLAIQKTWTEGGYDIEKAFQMVKECYVLEEDDVDQKVKTIQNKKEKLEKRKSNLLELRLDGEITKEEYTVKKADFENEIQLLENSLLDLKAKQNRVINLDNELIKIKNTLNQMIDFSGGIIDHDILEEVIERIVHTDDYSFDFYLNLGVENRETFSNQMEEKEIKVKQFGNKKGYETICQKHIKLFEFQIDFEMAKNYRKKFGKYLRESQWNNLNVVVYI